MSAHTPDKVEMTTLHYRGVDYPLRHIGGNVWEPVGMPYPIPRGEVLRISTHPQIPFSVFVTKEELVNMFLELRDFGKAAKS